MPLGIKGFQKGRAKSGGRRKGSLNRPKVRKTIVLEKRALPDKDRRRQRLIREEQERAERERRELEAAAASRSTTSGVSPATSPGPELKAPVRASHHHGLYETPLETWQRERRQAARSKNLSAGQVANLLDGLTPDGCDRNGRKVSFVESDKAAFGSSSRRLSGD